MGKRLRLSRRRIGQSLFIATISAATAPSVSFGQAIPAFPGADGAAANITGGRGGIVYHVTKLDASFSDTSAGTLRYGLTNANFPAGPRTIVFDVSGHFNLGRVVAGWDPNGNGWDTQSRLNIPSNVTVAGQTAPGPVVIHGGVIKPGGDNMILRNVIIAPGYGTKSFSEPGKPPPAAGDFPDSVVYDAIDISGTNLMIDHVTTVYSTDETISANELANNVTIQYSNISQGQNYPQADAEASGTSYTGHALGSLLQAGSNAKISVHHNLYAHQKGRLPRVGSEVGTGAHNDFRNNVFYNWLGTAGSGAGGQPSFNKFVGNFFLAGDGGENPVGGTSTAITTSAGGTGIFSGANSTGTRVFHSGNVKDINKDADALDTIALTNSDFGSSAFVADSSFTVPYLGVTDTAADAYDRVLNYAGATWWNRSAIDARIMQEVRTGTGTIKAWADDPFNADPNEGVEWRALVNTPLVSRPAGFDTDQDGMPDAWELKHNLNPAIPENNGDFDADGYTNLEEYINELAEWPAPQPIVFNGATNNRYAQITNWNIQWQPSKFDTARINSGTMIVDAVGQHANVIQVAGAAGQSAALNVTGGWIEIAQKLEVGSLGNGQVNQGGGLVIAGESDVIGAAPGATGTYDLTGGTLVTPLLTKGPGGGAFNFTGGTLSAAAVGFSLVNDGGTIAPGNSVGHTEVLGDLTLNAGTLAIELDGITSDTLGVSGIATLGGDLDVALLNGFVPADGDFWTILIADGGIKGRFANVPEGYSVRITGNELLLSYAVPEPGSAAAVFVAMSGMMLRRRARVLGVLQPTV
jgi:pectate lyase